ncbi:MULTISPECIES: hypothetical protein [Streptomyces]|uniref:hypothetical protein n=1 Tax=Streptomyces TaxID=1883 RepID=UPI0033EFEB57
MRQQSGHRWGAGYSNAPPTVVELTGDHYSVLKRQGIPELAAAIATRLGGHR